jgi:hypothetical protein
VNDIRRQGETHRPGPHGTVGPGLPEHVGPPPVLHQVKSIEVRIDVLSPGRVRVSTHQARGWAVVASGPRQLLDALQAAFTEAQLASYATWKGEPYELDELTEVDNSDPLATTRRTSRHGRHSHGRTERTDIHHPGEWAKMSDGRWRSPGGRLYREECDTVQRVLRKRRMLGEAG